MKKMYVIYHVPGKKVGCTVDFPQRCYDQGLKRGQFRVLERIPLKKGNKFAGDVEWKWADHFGYKRRIHYADAMERRSNGGKLGGKISFVSQMRRGTHGSLNGNTPFFKKSVQRAGTRASLKKHLRGPDCPWAKLTASEVKQIRRLLRGAGYGDHQIIAKQFGVSKGIISGIKHNNYYQSV